MALPILSTLARIGDGAATGDRDLNRSYRHLGLMMALAWRLLRPEIAGRPGPRFHWGWPTTCSAAIISARR